MKIFLVGASSSLGLKIGETAVGLGHEVIGTYCSGTSPKHFLSHQLDVRDSRQVAECVAAVEDQLGGIEAVIYCSAIDKPGLLINADLDAWSDVLDVNLLGAVRVVKQSLPLFLRRQNGIFQFISSGMATRSNPGAASYSASKAGLNALSRSVSKEYGPRGVVSYTIMPGFFNGGLIRNVSERDQARIATLIDSKRIGSVDEIASFAIASLQNSSYLTGSNLEITGGMQ